MKITDIAVTPDEVKQKTTGYFQTSIRDKPFVQGLIEEFSHAPRFFATMTNPEIESSHFTSWFNVLCLRQYDNPWIGDLYLIHELSHMAGMHYVSDASWSLWCNKVKQNETIASIFSEIIVYFEIPELREKTFDHPIWVDKILNDQDYQRIFQQNPEYFIQLMYQARMNTMLDPQDFVDRQIANYGVQNSLWCNIWRPFYNIVETHMKNWMQTGGSIEQHLHWLQSHSQNYQEDNFTPFADCAIQFAHQYAKIKKEFGNENLK